MKQSVYKYRLLHNKISFKTQLVIGLVDHVKINVD